MWPPSGRAQRGCLDALPTRIPAVASPRRGYPKRAAAWPAMATLQRGSDAWTDRLGLGRDGLLETRQSVEESVHALRQVPRMRGP